MDHTKKRKMADNPSTSASGDTQAPQPPTVVDLSAAGFRGGKIIFRGEVNIVTAPKTLQEIPQNVHQLPQGIQLRQTVDAFKDADAQFLGTTNVGIGVEAPHRPQPQPPAPQMPVPDPVQEEPAENRQSANRAPSGGINEVQRYELQEDSFYLDA